MKFKKRKNTIAPASIVAAGGDVAGALSATGVGAVQSMTLKHWHDYALTLNVGGGVGQAKINDLFVSGTAGDWEEDKEIGGANAATATALETARTIHGVSFDGTANIDLSEVIADTVGAMFSNNTETGITATYEDSDNTIDLVVGTLNQDTTGNAATVTNGVYTTGAQTIAGAKTFSSAVTVGNYTLPTAAGTDGQVLKYPSSGSTLTWGTGGGGSSPWDTSGNDISYTTGNVGFGVDSPNRKIEVAGGICFYNPTDENSTNVNDWTYGGTLGIRYRWPKEGLDLNLFFLDAGNVCFQAIQQGSTAASFEFGGYHRGVKFMDYLGNAMMYIFQAGTSTNYHLRVYGSSSNWTASGSSDDRIKHNEQNITNALDTINKLNIKKYFKSIKIYDASHNFDLDNSGNPITNDDYVIETGIIAQRVMEIPELAHLVSGGDYLDENGNLIENQYSLRYNDIFCTNIAATQELDKKVKELETKVESQETLIQTLIARIEALENN